MGFSSHHPGEPVAIAKVSAAAGRDSPVVNASQPLKHPCKKPGTVALGAVTVLRRVPQPASYSNRQAPGSMRDLASNNKVEKILKRVSDVSLWPLNVHISEHTFLHTHVCTHTHTVST